MDDARVDVVFGHSSHHPKAIEVYRGKPILYGCGDLINDYEGITGHDEFRGDLSLMYFPRVATATGNLMAPDMAAFRIRSMRLERANEADTLWLSDRLCRQGAGFGTDVTLGSDGIAHLDWR